MDYLETLVDLDSEVEMAHRETLVSLVYPGLMEVLEVLVELAGLVSQVHQDQIFLDPLDSLVQKEILEGLEQPGEMDGLVDLETLDL